MTTKMMAREALAHIEAEDYDDKDIDALTRLADAAEKVVYLDDKIGLVMEEEQVKSIEALAAVLNGEDP